MRADDAPDPIPPHVRAEIGRRLDAIEASGARVLFAVESGSRAWGFPSPDSDYDCRFVYLRPLAAYLALTPPRDVIEFPLEGDLDVNGWDVRKALRLLLKGNAVLVEWLTAPIVYRERPGLRASFLELAGEVASRAAVARHYLHLGEAMFDRTFADPDSVPLKKVFYALRPAAALRWLRLHEGMAVVPMHFPTLLAGCDVPPEVEEATRALLAAKAESREMGAGPVPPCLPAFIAGEFEAARETWPERSPQPGVEAVEAADRFFRRLVGVE